MKTPQVTGTTSHRLPSPFVLSDLLQMVSRQGVLLNLKSPQEVMQTFSGVLSQTQNVFDFQHLCLQQGGIELNLFVMSNLPSDLFCQNYAKPTRVLPSDDAASEPAMIVVSAANEGPLFNQNPEASASREMIQKETTYLFGYRRFQNDTLMASSALQTLSVVQEAHRAWMRKRNLPSGTLSKHDQARVLRDFLTRCVFYELSPDPGQPAPQSLLHESAQLRNQWIEYLILQWQYIDGLSRREVTQRLKTKIDQRLVVGNGTYTRRLKRAVTRLAALIWQKEMQAQKGQPSARAVKFA